MRWFESPFSNLEGQTVTTISAPTQKRGFFVAKLRRKVGELRLVTERYGGSCSSRPVAGNESALSEISHFRHPEPEAADIPPNSGHDSTF